MNAVTATNQPFVSVIIPVLNCADEVEPCISALRAQDYPTDRFEILVVDNGSTDDTVARLKAQGIPALHRAERGRSRALNEGLKHAQGTIICSTDISCRPEPNWLSEIVDSFADPSVGCVAGEIKLLKTQDNLAIRFQERNQYMSPMGAMQRTRPPFLPYADGANASFRREVFDKIGPFEESFIKAADVEICYRMLFLTDYTIVFNPVAVVWEPGEQTLRALLKQRFRIGIGNELMRVRFPDLYRKRAHRSWRARYWSARSAAVMTRRLVALLLTGIWRQQARIEFQELVVSIAMSVAQTAGRWHGRRYLRSANTVPRPVLAKTVAAYASGAWDSSDRVIMRSSA